LPFLEQSIYFGLIISSEWIKSDWTTLERVIPVYDDPAGIKARIIPILRRNCEIPPSIRILKWLDFRTDSNFESKILINKIIGKSLREIDEKENNFDIKTDLYDLLSPEEQEETIVSNIFQVLEIPKFINYAKSRVRSRNEVWDLLSKVHNHFQDKCNYMQRNL